MRPTPPSEPPGNPAPSPAIPALRPDGRRTDELRPVRFQNDIAPHATGSTLIQCGRTQVICAVMIEEGVPRWMKEQDVAGGWITAEYAMLPYSTLERKPRDITRGKLDGRSQEIQRLVGRALRAAVDLTRLGQRTVWVDCDVLQADGGTRTAAITGSYVALSLALRRLQARGTLAEDPIRTAVAATSVGIVAGQLRLDLDYAEDARATVDLNLVMTSLGQFIEIQGTGEHGTFSESQLEALLGLGRRGIAQLTAAQMLALAGSPSATPPPA